MTVVALTYINKSFLAISDSRITVASGPMLEKFSKLFVHRYAFSCGKGAKTMEVSCSGELGLAIAGSTLFGLAFSNMFARIIGEMHSDEIIDSPSFTAFRVIAERCGKILCGYILEEKQCFEVLIFGFDPRSCEAKWFQLKLGPGADGVEVTVNEQVAKNNEIISIGTGAKYLPNSLPKSSAVPLEVLISKLIKSQDDPATGGDLQIMELHSDRSTFLGTIANGSSSGDATYFGIKRSELGKVDGYQVGRDEPVELEPYYAVRNLALRKTQFLNKMDENVSDPARNIQGIMSFLAYVHKEKKEGVLTDMYTFERSPLISGSFYFAKVCPTCWRNSPSILSPAGDDVFEGKLRGIGSVKTSCQYCSETLNFTADDFMRQTLRLKS